MQNVSLFYLALDRNYFGDLFIDTLLVHSSFLQKVWKKDYSVCDYGCTDGFQLPADLLNQLGNVHSAFSYSWHGSDF